MHRPTRRRLRVAFALVCLLMGASLAHAVFVPGSRFADIWLTPDQQGRLAFERGDFRTAADRFENPLWKGVALYETHAFDDAIGQLARVDTPGARFDLGNANAHAGHLDDAVACYDQVLQQRPADEAARQNRDLVAAFIAKTKKAPKQALPPSGQPPTSDPDEVVSDDKGKQGSRTDVQRGELTSSQIEALWMRRLQTTPAAFLRLEFAAQAQHAASPAPAARGGSK